MKNCDRTAQYPLSKLTASEIEVLQMRAQALRITDGEIATSGSLCRTHHQKLVACTNRPTKCPDPLQRHQVKSRKKVKGQRVVSVALAKRYPDYHFAPGITALCYRCYRDLNATKTTKVSSTRKDSGDAPNYSSPEKKLRRM